MLRVRNRGTPSRRGVVAAGIALAFAGPLIRAASALPAEKKMAPAPTGCTFRLQAGQPITLSELGGKVVYLDFWASWCAPCLLSFPFMNRLQQEFGPKGLRIVAVNMDKNSADALSFLSKHTPSFDTTVGADPACAEAFGVADMPSTYLIDRAGMIRMSHRGFREGDAERLRSRVAALLAET